MNNDLTDALLVQTIRELLSYHGIDPTLFHTNAIELGPSGAYINGLDRWLNKKMRKRGMDNAKHAQTTAHQSEEGFTKRRAAGHCFLSE